MHHDLPYRQLLVMGSNAGVNPSRIGAARLQNFISHNSVKHVDIYDQADAINLISEIDIICLLSKHEGIPFVLLEALCSSSVIILSDIHAHRTVIGDASPESLGIIWAPGSEGLSRCYVQAWHMHQTCDVESILALRSKVVNKMSAKTVWPQWKTKIFV